MKKMILVIILVTFGLTSNAQPGVGCYRALDGFLYTIKNGFGYYELLGTRYPVPSNSCPRVQLGTLTGSKCQFVALGALHDEYNYILYTANGPYQCPLDDYAYGALALAGIFGIIRLRKR